MTWTDLGFWIESNFLKIIQTQYFPKTRFLKEKGEG